MKLIRFFEEDTKIRFANIDASACKDTFIASPLPHMQRPKEMLFDLVADPAERVNLIDVPEYADAYDELSALLDQHMIDTNDPMLNGKLELSDP